ncbi:uncharacterized protein LOC120356781 isoform X3 [Solenopsis invicta]|uniref:uncharacterized protein LOC120356781 isoform X3 n=1 Tax=Solenopsis invicta TaxID=13686 RepID=UPI00193D59AB|nr:uncharacterized protein LOC120356781 isoform X3 [Solenopsis invicta]
MRIEKRNEFMRTATRCFQINMANEMPVDNVLSVVASVICNQLDDYEKDDKTSSSSSSSEENSSEEDDICTLYAILMVSETRSETFLKEKLNDYVEQVVPGYSKIIFKEHFRIFPETFQIVLRFLRPALNVTNTRGRKQISPEKQFMITLWFMARFISICMR